MVSVLSARKTRFSGTGPFVFRIHFVAWEQHSSNKKVKTLSTSKSTAKKAAEIQMAYGDQVTVGGSKD